MNDELSGRMKGIEDAGQRRDDLVISALKGAEVVVDGRSVINLASNDYLGLATHPALRDAAARVAQEQCVGVGAARLVTGTHELHHRLEDSLARLMGVERALLMGSGYLAHVGALPALAREGDVIYSDALNHASVVDGCRLSHARVRIYRHGDVEHLGDLLLEDQDRGGNRIVVTETVFSMEGDEAPLAEICEAANRHKAWVMVDEAHAFGLRGRAGAGLVSALGLEDWVHVRMGTLGKAAGCYGAFLAGSAELIDYLKNRSRTYIYSTALPLPVVASGLRAIELIASAEGERRRTALIRATARLRRELQSQGWEMPRVPGPILPMVIGDPDRAVGLSRALLEAGVLVRAMRYPTVPLGTERLRLIASAAHTEDQLRRVMEVFERLKRSAP